MEIVYKSGKFAVLIVEDNLSMALMIKDLLANIDYLNILDIVNNGLKAVELVKSLSPDIVFLDIEIPGIDGLQVAEIICESNPKTLIIFLTAYDKYIKKAFKVYAFDYIVKPFSVERIYKTMERAKLWLSEAKLNTLKNLIVVNNFFLDIEDIIFISREDNHTIVVTSEQKISINESLDSVEQKVSNIPYLFRCYRSYIVNLKKLKEIKPFAFSRKTYKLIMRDTKEIAMATREKVKEIEELLGIKRNKFTLLRL